MTGTSATLVQGTLDMLILKTLTLEPLHGWGISQRIQQLSHGVFEVNPGSLFPAFRRLERAGLLECEWRTSENNRRAKYYSLTKAGWQKLRSHRKDFADGFVKRISRKRRREDKADSSLRSE
jgi:PadR family transcriptional regulator, regulatory protein PadR